LGICTDIELDAGTTFGVYLLRRKTGFLSLRRIFITGDRPQQEQ
jgi:hypothetical protein